MGDGAIFASDVEDFGPEPFAGVDPADIARVILFARLVAQAGDRLGFLDRGVILPQDKHGVRVVSEFCAAPARCPRHRREPELSRCCRRQCPRRRRAVRRSAKRARFQRRFHGLDVISRVMAEAVVSAIAILSFPPARYHSTLVASSAPDAHSTARARTESLPKSRPIAIAILLPMQKSFMQQQ